MKKVSSVTLPLLMAITWISTAAAANSPFQFTLRSHEGREWNERDFADKPLVVVAFLGTECPLAKLYGPRLQALADQYGDELAVIGVNANTQDSMTDMSAYAERHGIKFPLLKDLGNKVADQFQAKRTPEVFLLDRDRVVRYQGRIDDQYSVGVIRDKAEREDLAIAVEELLAGKQITVASTEAVGCHIGRVKKAAPTGDITYSKHVAQIFDSRCVECHREGELAPFPLESYEDVIGWEDTICEVIEDNRMPPWFANPQHGKFRNDCRMSDEEKQLVYQWVENGMPEGDPADLPAPPQFHKGWRIPQPDQVFYMREAAFEVPAQGSIDYQYFVVDPGWEEDKYISAAEARPDNKAVVHHILVFIVPKGQRYRGGLDRILVGYAPGSTPVLLDEGVAIKVPAGSQLLFQMHYTPNGYEEHDRSYAGVKFMDEKDVKTLIRGKVAIQQSLRIPAQVSDHVVTSEYRVANDELLVSMTPHMHLRGKAFRYEANYPNGEQEILLDVPRYDFNWQLKYILDEPKLLPRGTTIKCTAVFDNSEQNPFNPDPSIEVHWGDQSWEEMMIGFFDTIPAEQEQAAPRKSQPTVDPTGSYQWKGVSPGKLTLTLHDDVVAGSLESRGKSVPIQDAVLNGDQLEFRVQLGPMQFEFNAKVFEDAIRGKIQYTMETVGRGGELPWVAHKDAG